MADLDKLTAPFPTTAHKQRKVGGGRMLDYVEMYEDGRSINEIAAAIGSNYSTARRLLLAAGVTLRSNAEGTRIAAPRSSKVRWGCDQKTTRRCCRCHRDLPLDEFAMRSNGKFRRSECYDCRREVSAKRRSLTKGTAFQIDYRRIVARDGWVCHICGLPVQRGAHHFDHVIPLSRGGSHCEDNIRVAHAFCNQSKGDRLPKEYRWPT